MPRTSAVQKPLPIDQWKICHRDKYPAYIDWATFETIQAMIRDNHSEYDRNKTRGVPRPGKALLHGIVYCGECGHKMVVQYKGRTCYLCNYLRQQYQVPVCQNLPADPIDAYVVGAFFDGAVPGGTGPVRPGRGRPPAGRRTGPAGPAAATRTAALPGPVGRTAVHQADPDNRLVAAELERRWEAAAAGTEGGGGEVTARRRPQDPGNLNAEERGGILQAGRKIPELWRQGRLSPQQQKSFLRCLI